MPKGRFHCLVHPRVQLPSPNPGRSEKLGTTHPCYVSTLLVAQLPILCLCPQGRGPSAASATGGHGGQDGL